MSDLLVKHASMAGAGPIDPTPLPWPRPMVPNYQPTSRVGKYRIQKLDVHMVGGYFRGNHPTVDPIWSLTCRGRAVDRIDEVSLESYAPHIAAAHGHTLLIGFGMGVMALNLLMQPAVTKVTILDPRATEVAFMLKSNGMQDHPLYKQKLGKLVLGKQANTVTVQEIGKVDHMFVEGQIGSVDTMRTVAATVKGTKPDSVSWKGMEIDYVDWLHTAHVEHNRPVPITADIAADTGNLQEWASAGAKYGVHVRPIISLEGWGNHAYRAVKNVTIY